MELSKFLSLAEEEEIKNQYHIHKANGDVDADIIPILDELNSIDGLATLYSCQGHLYGHESYLVLKCSEELTYPFTEAIWELREEFPDLKIEWSNTVFYKTDKSIDHHLVTILRGTMNWEYMSALLYKLQD